MAPGRGVVWVYEEGMGMWGVGRVGGRDGEGGGLRLRPFRIGLSRERGGEKGKGGIVARNADMEVGMGADEVGRDGIV